MYSNTFPSSIIFLPSSVDDKLVFGLGDVWTTFAAQLEHRVHTDSAGDCSSFLNGPQKRVKNKHGEQVQALRGTVGGV